MGIDIKKILEKGPKRSLSDRFTSLDKEYLGDIYINRRLLSNEDKLLLLTS